MIDKNKDISFNFNNFFNNDIDFHILINYIMDLIYAYEIKTNFIINNINELNLLALYRIITTHFNEKCISIKDEQFILKNDTIENSEYITLSLPNGIIVKFINN